LEKLWKKIKPSKIITLCEVTAYHKKRNDEFETSLMELDRRIFIRQNRAVKVAKIKPDEDED